MICRLFALTTIVSLVGSLSPDGRWPDYPASLLTVVNVVAFLDEPLPPRPLTLAERGATVFHGQRVIVVGRLTPSEEFVNKFGARFFCQPCLAS